MNKLSKIFMSFREVYQAVRLVESLCYKIKIAALIARNDVFTQRGFIKLSKHTLVSYLIVSTILFGTGIAFLIKPWFGGNNVDAAWFNDNWGFRQEVPITANAAADTNVFFSFTLDTATLITAGQLQSACQDIRVTDVNGNILPYHVGRTNACNNAATTIDALAPYAPNSATPTLIAGASTFYVYYGNPSVVSKDQGAFSQSEAATYTVGTLGSAASAPSSTVNWKFNEGVDGTCTGGTNDACNSGNGGNGLNLAQANMTSPSATSGWQTEDQCISGKCLRFDGSNDILTTSGFASTFFTASYTQSFWLKTTQTGNKVLTEKGANLAFIQTNDGQIRAGNTNSAADYTDTTGTPLVTDGNWHYVVVTYNGTTNLLTIYIDGISRGTKTTTNDATSSATDYAIGARVGIAAPFAGTIDEVKVYNFAETAAQVLADFNARSNPEGVSQQQGNNIQNMPQALSNGLTGYWKMDESSLTAADSSGNGLTLTNNNTTAYASGKFGNAGSFTAASSMYLSTATTISGVKTVSFWTYNASTTDDYINLTASAYTTSSSGTVSATGFTSPTIYVNGVVNGTLIASQWNHVAITTGTGIDANAFEVGRANSSYNNGKIDDVRTYNRALSASDITQLYNWAPGPVAYFNMEEGGTANPTDKSGNGLTATWSGTGTSRYAAGKYGKTANFNGTDDYISVTNNAVLNPLMLTVSAWVKSDNATWNENGFIVSKRNAYIIHPNAGTTGVNFYIYTTSFQAIGCTPSTAITTWNYYSMTWDGTTFKAYINGVQCSSGTPTGPISTADTGEMDIGKDDGLARYIDGQIDEVKVYNYARTNGQITEDMNAGHPAPGSPVSSAVGYWKFNEGADNTCSGGTNDACNSGSAGNAIDLAKTGATWSQAGKFGRAFSFDGSADYLEKSSPTSFIDNSQGTVSLWAKLTTTTQDSTFWSISTDGTTDDELRLSYEDSGDTIAIYLIVTGSNTLKLTAANAISDTNWHYIALNSNGSTIKLYVDGVEKTLTAAVGTNSGQWFDDATDASVFSVGILQRAVNIQDFNGLIDEVKVYSSALSAAQVNLDMNQSSTQVLGALSDNSSYQKQAANQEYCVPGDTTSCVAPVARWDLEEGSGTAANDSSGNANTGTITAGTGSYTKGKLGKGYLFDGATTSINSGSGTTLDNLPAAGMTLEAWIYPKSVGETAGFILTKSTGASGSTGWVLAMNTGTNLQFLVDGSTDLYIVPAGTPITLNAWNHVALSWDGVMTTAASVHIYVNGKEVSYSNQVNGASRVDDASSTFYIGNNSDSDRTFDGTIDAVRVFNYARSASQVAWDYNKGGPVGYWKMDECQGTTINDSAGNSLTGTLTIGATGTYTAAGTCTVSSASSAWYNGATGKRNYSMAFDGTDDVITVSDNDKLDFSATESLTTAVWVKSTDSGVSNLVTKYHTDNKYYSLEMNPTATFGIGDGPLFPTATSGLSVNDGNWHHLVGVRDVTADTLYIYVDGVRRGSATDTTTATIANAGNLTMGDLPAVASRDLTGQLDDARVYRYALTAAQVKTLYTQGAANYGPLTGAP